VVARKHAIFCSSWVRSFIPKFVESIFKIKGITEMGGNQLLLDVTVLRKVLLEAPFVSMSEETKTPSKRAFMLFNKYVTEEMLKVENLLKVINSPNERIVLRFKTMLTHMKPEDLAKVHCRSNPSIPLCHTHLSVLLSSSDNGSERIKEAIYGAIN
jgi:hypothetical protein